MEKELFQTKDLWEHLNETEKPVVLYGTGDGADKILNICEAKGIRVSGVFASDGFVRKRTFRGFEVMSFSDTTEKFSDPVILMSFASSLTPVLDNVKNIASRYELFCPDVPVFGGGLFDRNFVEENFEHFSAVYGLLSDEKSKQNYINLILGKMTGRIDFIISSEIDVKEAYGSIIRPVPNGHYVDIGAYNGDTIREYLSFSGGFGKITAFEPDKKNFSKLLNFAVENNIPTDNFYNIAAWNKREDLTFYSRSGRNSAGTTSRNGAKSVTVFADTADGYINSKVDYINIDAEGSDKEVIEGLCKTIQNYRPCVSCALYHRNEDFFEIPLMLQKMYGECEMYIRHFAYLPAWDTNIYVKPKK